MLLVKFLKGLRFRVVEVFYYFLSTKALQVYD